MPKAQNKENIKSLMELLRKNPFKQKAFENKLVELKEVDGFDINEYYQEADGTLISLLHQAVGSDKIDIVNVLIKAGANVNIGQINPNGVVDSPFDIGVILDRTAICKMLIEEGAAVPKKFQHTAQISESLVNDAKRVREKRLEKQSEFLTNFSDASKLDQKALNWLMKIDGSTGESSYLSLPKILNQKSIDSKEFPDFEYSSYAVKLKSLIDLIEVGKNQISPSSTASKAKVSSSSDLNSHQR